MAKLTLSGNGGAALKRWLGKLKGVKRLRRKLAVNLAEECVELVREGFEAEADPYGKAWAPTQRGGRILQDTGRMRSSVNRTVTESTVKVSVPVEYAGFHQGGTSRMPARKVVPDEGDLPPRWEARLDEVAEDLLTEHFED